MFTLHYSPMAVALAAHIALEEAGAPYETVRVDLKGGEQRSDAYLKLNPKGRVPVLVTPRGILTETPAMLAFIAQTYPAAQLAPLGDAFAFAKMQEFNSYLATTVHVAHAHKGRGTRWATEPASLADMAAKVPENVRACFGLIEHGMLAGPWVMGSAYSVADPYLFTIASWLAGDGVDIREFPRVNEHHTRMSARATVARVMTLHGR
jgi:glutathione S-transferase